MEALGDTLKHDTQNQIYQNAILIYQQDAWTTVHIPILHATEKQYFRDLPSCQPLHTEPGAFKLLRCVPRTAAADGKSNAIRLCLKLREVGFGDLHSSASELRETRNEKLKDLMLDAGGWLLGKGGLRNIPYIVINYIDMIWVLNGPKVKNEGNSWTASRGFGGGYCNPPKTSTLERWVHHLSRIWGDQGWSST